MNKIEQTYIIPASPTNVWRALTDPDAIEEWSEADADFPLEVGAGYSLWDGSISGVILEIVPRKKLVQTWKPDNWTVEDSVVTFKLTPVGSKTRVDLLHENVEDFDYEGTTEGWNLYYLGAIQRMFESRPQEPKVTASRKTHPKPGTSKKKTARKTPPKRRIAKRKVKSR